MLVAIDIGATKTLVATFGKEPTALAKKRPGATEASARGGGRSRAGPKPTATKKLPTDTDIETWTKQTIDAIDELGAKEPIDQIVVASRGEILDKDRLTITDHKKLGWYKAPIGQKLKDHYQVPVHVHHDTAMGALGESTYGAGTSFASLLYLTISTGIGTAMVIDGEVHKPFARSTGGDMVIGHTALTQDSAKSTIEKRLSGEAMKERWDKYGYEIPESDSIWVSYGEELALALNNMIVLVEPDAVVLAGGVSVHFDKFMPFIKRALKAHTTSPYPLPKFLQAKYVETSVIYGCHAWARQVQNKK